MGWLQQQMMAGVHPRSILDRLLPTVASSLPPDLNEFEVWSLIADYFQMLREPPRRKKLPDVNTFDDALSLLRSSKRIMVLTGAGVRRIRKHRPQRCLRTNCTIDECICLPW